MDVLRRNGFSEDQLRGVDIDAILKLYDQIPRTASIPVSQINGTDKTDGCPQKISAVAKPRTLPDDTYTHGYLEEELRSASAAVNGSQSSQQRTALVAQSLSAPLNEMMPIAIVGMSCRFPGGASDIEKFRELVADGRSARSEVPESRFNVDAFYHPNSDRTDSVGSRARFGMFEVWPTDNLDECQSRPFLTRNRLHSV